MAEQPPEQPKEPPRGNGGELDASSTADQRIVQRAVTEGWDIPEGVLQAFPAELIRIVAKSKEGTRERLRAMELMVKMRGQNIGDRQELVITQQVAIMGGDADRLCDRMLGEVEYERLQRDRAVQADGDPGPVGEIGERRALDPPPPHSGNGRGPNGRGPAPGERGD